MSGDLELNKILGAGLATAFVILMVREGSAMIYAPHAPEKMGYFVDAPEEAAGGAGEAELPPDWGTVIPVADVAAGEAAFARCVACHTINSGGANGIGPNLYGVVGRQVAGVGGFAYSEAMVGHQSVDPTWSLDALDQFITAPQRYVSGTKMSFAGLRDTQTRVNLIAYLRAQGSPGFPVPAPDPARQPGAAAAGAAPADGAATTGAGALPEGTDPAAGAPGTTPSTAPTTGPGGQPTTEEAPVAPPAAESLAPGNDPET